MANKRSNSGHPVTRSVSVLVAPTTARGRLPGSAEHGEATTAKPTTGIAAIDRRSQPHRMLRGLCDRGFCDPRKVQFLNLSPVRNT
jgi:hypothetical protein